MPAGRGALLAHVQTWRPYTLWYVGLVGIAGAGLAGGQLAWSPLLAAWAAPTVGWIGGHYLGDYFDRRLDAISKPHRPIPSGRLRPGSALACGIACLVAVAALAVAGGWATTVIAMLAVAGIVGYGGWLKSRGLAGNLVRGALGTLVLLYGAAAAGWAHDGWTQDGWTPDGWTPDGWAPNGWVALAAFAVAFWAHDTASNLVGTLRDEQGDRAGGYRTVAAHRGWRAAAGTATLCYGVAIAAAVAGGLSAPASGGPGGFGAGGPDAAGVPAGFLAVLAASAVLGAAALLTVQPLRPGLRSQPPPGLRSPLPPGLPPELPPEPSPGLPPGPPELPPGPSPGLPPGPPGPPPAARIALRAHELLVLERIGFTGAVIGLGFGLATAVALSVPALVITWWVQARMRAGHEFGPRAVPPPAAGTHDGLAHPPARPELG